MICKWIYVPTEFLSGIPKITISPSVDLVILYLSSLIHGHACVSSKGKIGNRHDFVRDTRFAMLKESSVEAGDRQGDRTCRIRDQCSVHI